MKIAVIDMGTNTFHLLLAEVSSNDHKVLHRLRKPVRIGEKGISEGRINPEAWQRALTTISEFKAKIDAEQIDKVFATATSAIRNASNGQKLVDEIKQKTGIETTIISGVREAELILFGVRHAMDLGDEKNLIIDIGGGSIEFIIADSNKTYWLQSFEVGGQRLMDRFHGRDPIGERELQELDQYLDEELTELIEQCEIYRPANLIGCSGTFETLSDIYRSANEIPIDEEETEHLLPLEAFAPIYKDLLKKTRAERLKIPGMIEMRVDMIVVASALIDYLIKKFKIQHLRISAYALKEGVLFDAIDEARNSIDTK